MSLKLSAALVCAVSALSLSAGASAATTFNFSFSVDKVWLGSSDYYGSMSGSGELTGDYDTDQQGWVLSGASGTITTSDWGNYQINSVSSGFSFYNADDDSWTPEPALLDPSLAVDQLMLSGTNEDGVSNDFLFRYFSFSPQLQGLMGEVGGDATFTITQADAATSDVPEAATWSMMVAGFGLMGAALRRQRVSVSFA